MPGVTVDLYAWPLSKVLDGMKAGQKVPTTLLATATANASGRYALAVAPGELKPYANSGGYANMEVQAGTAHWFFPVLAARPSVTQVPALSGLPDPCGGSWTFWRHLRRPWVTVLQGYIVRSRRTKGDTFSTSYSQGASSTLGMDVGGNADNFADATADGTDSESANGTVTFPTLKSKGYAHFQTQFQASEFWQICPDDNSGSHEPYCGPCPKVQCNRGWCLFTAAATGWVGDANVAGAKVFKHPGWTCGYYKKGSGYGESRTKAVTWGAGLSVPSIGFSASAQTGYTKVASISFKFPDYSGYACGSNDVVPKAKQVLIEAS